MHVRRESGTTEPRREPLHTSTYTFVLKKKLGGSGDQSDRGERMTGFLLRDVGGQIARLRDKG